MHTKKEVEWFSDVPELGMKKPTRPTPALRGASCCEVTTLLYYTSLQCLYNQQSVLDVGLAGGWKLDGFVHTTAPWMIPCSQILKFCAEFRVNLWHAIIQELIQSKSWQSSC
eukprot:TRINITY_DN433_c0_g1_i1.p1 TRINITY_DN433_c0_g1~~TRINITY_DN433_c0_g1_i1.p1  ORF type:complete len:119 (+),score=1.42 TRINITY_DN433_c0_g1_i1:22-357(+)